MQPNAFVNTKFIKKSIEAQRMVDAQVYACTCCYLFAYKLEYVLWFRKFCIQQK